MKVFIHTNDKQKIGAKVSHYSFVRHNPDLEVELIELKDYPVLTQRQGHTYSRSGQTYVWDNEDLQSFTPLRFAAAERANYKGSALIVDPDVFCLMPLGSIGEKISETHPIACRYVGYWASSVMLLKCDQLQSWKFDEIIYKLFNGKLDYRDLMSLTWISDDIIKNLDEAYNSFDTINEDTILLHNTSRVTQPWKTGLEIDYLHDNKLKVNKVRRLLGSVKRAVYKKRQYYQPHPDHRQIELFLEYLKGAVESGYILESEIIEAIKLKYVRKDLMDLIK